MADARRPFRHRSGPPVKTGHVQHDHGAAPGGARHGTALPILKRERPHRHADIGRAGPGCNRLCGAGPR
ncbi:hypothetical protein AZA_24977 [Nitrospirillum viridazoti Y2]|nr:hypothetical protein AZA_24977 [Nitrospirillum amazonense Y2]